MASVSAYPTAAGTAGDSEYTNPWSWKEAIYSSGTAQSSNSTNSCVKTQKLGGSGFGFNIPANAVVTGVKIDIRYANNTPSSNTCTKAHSMGIILSDGSTYYKTGVAYVPGTNTSNLQTWTIGGEGQLLGLPSNPAAYNNGVTIQYWAIVGKTTGSAYTSFVDYFHVTIYYTEPTYTESASIDTQAQLGSVVNYTVELDNTNNTDQGVPIPIDITIPEGLSYDSQSGDGYFYPESGVWYANLVNGTAVLNLSFIATEMGYQTVTAAMEEYDVSISQTTNITAPSYTLSSNLPATLTQAQNATYTITVTAATDYITSVDINAPIPAELQYISSSLSTGGTYNSTTGVWHAVFHNRTATLTLTIKPNTLGQTTQNINIPNGPSLESSSIVVSPSVTTPYSTLHALPSEITSLMVNGRNYTISCYSKVTDSLGYVYPGLKNFKIAMVQGSNEQLGSRVAALSTVERISVSFVYDSSQTPYLKLYGQYPEVSPSTPTPRFFGFAIKEGWDTNYDTPGVFFDVQENLRVDGEYTTAIIPVSGATSPLIFDEINFAGRQNDPNLIIKGLAISMDYVCTAQLELDLTINMGSQYGVKSVILDPIKTNVIVGGEIDDWNLNDIDLDDLTFTMKIKNNLTDIRGVEVKNVQFILYSQYDETRGTLGFTLDGVHSKNYNLFITKDWDKPEGLDKDIDTLNLKKSDGDLITGVSTKSKSIKIKFQVLGAEIKEMQERLKDAVAWMTNDLDVGRRPITKALVFDWDPDRIYEVVLSKTISVDYDIGQMMCEATFLLPKGVASGPVRVTGNVDANNGIVNVRPLIQIKTDGSSTVVLTESYSGQTLTLNHQFAANTILYIDCDAMVVYDDQDNDYSTTLTPDSSYPVLNPGNFNFSTSTGCIIQAITFSEGL